MISTILRKSAALAIMAVFAGPALAATYAVHIPLKGITVVTTQPPVTPPQASSPSWTVTGTAATAFGSSNIGVAAPVLTLAVKNIGAAGTLAAPAFTGANASDFSVSSDCVNVPKDGTCTITVGFTPSGPGARSATLSVGGVSKTYTGTGLAVDNDVVFMLHGDGVNGSANFVDSAGNSTFTNAGAKLSASVSRFGGSSIYLDGNSSLTVNNPRLAFGTGDYTIEWWHYQVGDSNGDIFIGPGVPRIRGMDSKVTIFGDNGAYVQVGMKTNTWQHYALVRNKGMQTLYQDGKAVLQMQNSSNFTGTAATFGRTVGYGYFITAYIDDMRVTRAAVYTSNFTVPTAPY